ncbi:hypothetical protein BBJ28_00010463 [Nothophytophthora sp. Chile5]|nr:hypothetical protein BBJ28_00010463 [Nothophytophthora sp. Chile5]
MEEDVAVETPWCAVCRRSSTIKWRKHVFAKQHQLAARQFLLAQIARLETLCAAASGATAASPEERHEWRRCVFCTEASESGVAWQIQDAAEHFGSQAHRKQVEAFCRKHRCGQDRQARARLWLGSERRREVLSALAQREADAKAVATAEALAGNEVDTAEEDRSAVRTEAFLSSAAARLQQVQHLPSRQPVDDEDSSTLPSELSLEPRLPLAMGARRLKTLTSPDGVVQNPLGQHNGQRVWGGGIVKLRKAEWLPWPIDQLVKEETEHSTAEATGSVDGAGDHTYTHRVTELAYGEGLDSIASVSWRSSVGNVHTAAVPPWMVQSEEEYKQCNRREQSTSRLPSKTSDGGSETRRDIFSVLQEREYGPDWLPNFGGVWQEGPRSKTKKVFRTASHSSHDPTVARRNATGVSPPPVQAKPQRGLPSGSCETQQQQQQQQQQQASRTFVPAPPTHSPPPTKERSQPALPLSLSTQPHPIASAGTDEPSVANALDAKKQLLLAQKERLRAKLAARQRRTQS